LFDVVSVLEKLTIEDIREVAKDLISDERMTVCQVLPK
jgi:predicted Zn-dependent peptidase